MHDTLTDVPGFAVGHAQDGSGLTGCTVVLCEGGAVVGVDVRGSAPATRETDLCRPGTLVERANAVFLTGGSAFGLDACAGVMRFLHERSIGFETRVTRIPIVPAAAIFDLDVGDAAWPDPEMAHEACVRASTAPVVQGCVGAGMGAAVGRMLGLAHATKGGLGSAAESVGPVAVAALAVVNAVGNVVSPESGQIVAGSRDPASGRFRAVDAMLPLPDAPDPFNTTLAVVATDADLTKEQVNHLAGAGHDGIARVIRPAHTRYDGDAVFGLAAGRVPLDWPALEPVLTGAVQDVVARAVINAVRFATPAAGLPVGIFA